MPCNKNIYLSNIKYLASRLGIKTGELEQNAGISIGYLSRLSKEGNDSNLSVESLYKISELLNISLDLLISYDMSLLSNTEQYIIDFLNKIYLDTINSKLSWNYERYRDFENNNIISGMPYWQTNNFHTYYHSEISKDCYEVIDEIYYSDINKNKKIFIIKLEVSDYCHGYECILQDNGQCSPLCNTLIQEKEIFIKTFNDLYELIHNKVREPKIAPELREIIDNYMKK